MVGLSSTGDTGGLDRLGTGANKTVFFFWHVVQFSGPCALLALCDFFLNLALYYKL